MSFRGEGFWTFWTFGPTAAHTEKPDSRKQLCLGARLFPLASPAGLAGSTYAFM